MIVRNTNIRDVPAPAFKVNGDVVCESDKVKYLGHVLCSDCTDNFDIMRQRRQLYALGNSLSRRFSMCSTAVKNALFRTFCTLLYTCQLWSNYSNESIRKLHVAYNNAYRMLYKLPTYCSASLMFAVNNLPSCQAVIRNLTFRFMCWLSASTNDLVSSLLASEVKSYMEIQNLAVLVRHAVC